jgi:hypothetical protein
VLVPLVTLPVGFDALRLALVAMEGTNCSWAAPATACEAAGGAPTYIAGFVAALGQLLFSLLSRWRPGGRPRAATGRRSVARLLAEQVRLAGAQERHGQAPPSAT